jgi:hypothetical protein
VCTDISPILPLPSPFTPLPQGQVSYMYRPYQDGPGNACRLVGQRYRYELGRFLGQKFNEPGVPFRAGARMPDHRRGADNQQAASSRPDLKRDRSVMVIVGAVAIITPMPGIVSSR